LYLDILSILFILKLNRNQSNSLLFPLHFIHYHVLKMYSYGSTLLLLNILLTLVKYGNYDAPHYVIFFILLLVPNIRLNHPLPKYHHSLLLEQGTEFHI
jgi:hypothetical protein